MHTHPHTHLVHTFYHPYRWYWHFLSILAALWPFLAPETKTEGFINSNIKLILLNDVFYLKLLSKSTWIKFELCLLSICITSNHVSVSIWITNVHFSLNYSCLRSYTKTIHNLFTKDIHLKPRGHANQCNYFGPYSLSQKVYCNLFQTLVLSTKQEDDSSILREFSMTWSEFHSQYSWLRGRCSNHQTTITPMFFKVKPTTTKLSLSCMNLFRHTSSVNTPVWKQRFLSWSKTINLLSQYGGWWLNRLL